MTVEELINILNQYPKDTKVVYPQEWEEQVSVYFCITNKDYKNLKQKHIKYNKWENRIEINIKTKYD